MRTLHVPRLPRLGAPAAAPRSKKASAPPRILASSVRGIPITLRLSESAQQFAAPVARARRVDVQGPRSFSAFVRALHAATDHAPSMEIEAFCLPGTEPAGAALPAQVVAPAAPASAVVPAPADPTPATEVVPPGASREELDDLAAIRAAAGAPVGGTHGTEDVPLTPPAAIAGPAPRVPSRAASTWPTHEIFDRMGMATTFDVGNVSLVHRFHDLDAQLDREAVASAARSRSRAVEPERGVDDVELARDLSMLRASMSMSHTLAPAVTTQSLSPANGGRFVDERALSAGDILLVSDSSVRRSLLYLGGGEVAEGTSSGVSVRPLVDAIAVSEVVVDARVPEATDAQRTAVVAFARDRRATPYAAEGIVRQGLFRLEPASHCAQKSGDDKEKCLSWSGRVLLTAGDDPDYCLARLVLDAYASAGVPLTAQPPAWDGPLPYIDLVLARPLAYVGHLKAPLPR